MALAYIRPDADTTDGGWKNASGNNTNLYDSLNETVASDADYIRSDNFPDNDIVKLRLSNFGSSVTEPMTVRYRYKKVVSGSDMLSLKVRLVQGSTTIAEWEHEDVGTSYVDGEQELTTDQFNDITDFDDLYLEFEAITGSLGNGAIYLLDGETEGFAIDATQYGATPLEFVGGPRGGAVAVIDVGTPANNLTDVCLDKSNLTNSSASAKVVHHSTSPYVRWSSHNMFPNSEAAASWATSHASVTSNAVTAPDGTLTADKIVEDTAGGEVHLIRQAAGTVGNLSNHIYTMSAYVKAAERKGFLFGMFEGSHNAFVKVINLDTTPSMTGSGTNGNGVYIDSGVITVGDGWYRIWMCGSLGTVSLSELNFAVLDGSNNSGYTGDGTSGAYIWGMQFNRGYGPTPYLKTSSARTGIPLSYNATDGVYEIVHEDAVANLVLNSQTIVSGGGWSFNSLTSTSNQTTAPDGSISADKITISSSLASHSAYPTALITTTSGEYHTSSIYVKRAASEQYFYLSFGSWNDSTKWVAVVFDFNSETFGSGLTGAVGTFVDATATEIGDGWYRLALTASGITDTQVYPQFGFSNSLNPSPGSFASISFTGNGTDAFYLWGAQLEIGGFSIRSFASSYIPTFGASVTRAKDQISLTGSSISITGGPFSFWWQGSIGPDIAFAGHIALYTENQNAVLIGTSGVPAIILFAEVANVNQVFMTLADPAPSTTFLLAARLATNDSIGCVNGTFEDVADTTCTVPAITTIGLGKTPYGDEGTTRFQKLVIVPRAYNDSELDALTTA